VFIWKLAKPRNTGTGPKILNKEPFPIINIMKYNEVKEEIG
jgi:hypothetical protein